MATRRQTARQQLFKSQLLTVRSYDATHVVAEDPESGQTHTLPHDFVRLHCRSGHAYTIASCQGRQYSGSVALWDTRHARWTKRRAYTALSRARARLGKPVHRGLGLRARFAQTEETTHVGA